MAQITIKDIDRRQQPLETQQDGTKRDEIINDLEPMPGKRNTVGQQHDKREDQEQPVGYRSSAEINERQQFRLEHHLFNEKTVGDNPLRAPAKTLRKKHPGKESGNEIQDKWYPRRPTDLERERKNEPEHQDRHDRINHFPRAPEERAGITRHDLSSGKGADNAAPAIEAD